MTLKKTLSKRRSNQRTITELKAEIEVLRAELARTAQQALDAELKLEQVTGLLDLPPPSEQTGPEWERCVRVPVQRLADLGAVLH